MVIGCLSPAYQAGVPEENAQIPLTENVTRTPPGELPLRGSFFSSTLMEIDRGVALNSTILLFSEDLKKIAPELERGMREAGGSPTGWYDGRRYANTVELESEIDDVFCNVRRPHPVCINATGIYEFHGRYLEFVCLGHPVTQPTAGGGYPAG
jgi:hypothetical protein